MLILPLYTLIFMIYFHARPTINVMLMVNKLLKPNTAEEELPLPVDNREFLIEKVKKKENVFSKTIQNGVKKN